MQNWNRWDKDQDYQEYEKIEVIYIDSSNQICLRLENTKSIVWNRNTDIIIGWRPVVKPIVKNKEISITRYWNYVNRKFWPNLIVPPNPKLPNYLKVTMTLKEDGKIETKYDLHSIYQLPICHCRHGESTY